MTNASNPSNPSTIRVAIVGPTGYTGRELITLLARHPGASVRYLASARDQLPDIRDEFPQVAGLIDEKVARCRPIDPKRIAEAADVAMVGLPHGTAMVHVPHLLDAGLRVIDFSADYRIRDAELYGHTYAHTHQDRANLADAVYGLPELGRAQLPSAKLVANPGCYPTAAALGLGPLLRKSLIHPDRITINAASGTTGAGRKTAGHLQLSEHHDAFCAYGPIGSHRHQPELEQTLTEQAGSAVSTLFVPHLLPIDRGILETMYLEPIDPRISQAELFETFEEAYTDEPFVRLRPATGPLPNIKHVLHTNYCDLSIRLTGAARDQPRLIVFAALDNLVKGAAGQAIQNLNAMCGLAETTGMI